MISSIWLVGTNYPGLTIPNGYTHDLQELPFFSWFYGALGQCWGTFSDNGTFKTDWRSV